MDKQKRTIFVAFTDLDDIEKVLDGIDNLLRQIMLYYIETNMKNLWIFITSLTVYLDTLNHLLNIKDTLTDDEEKNDK